MTLDQHLALLPADEQRNFRAWCVSAFGDGPGREALATIIGFKENGIRPFHPLCHSLGADPVTTAKLMGIREVISLLWSNSEAQVTPKSFT